MYAIAVRGGALSFGKRLAENYFERTDTALLKLIQIVPFQCFVPIFETRAERMT
jgi:hypothetical protein